MNHEHENNNAEPSKHGATTGDHGSGAAQDQSGVCGSPDSERAADKGLRDQLALGHSGHVTDAVDAPKAGVATGGQALCERAAGDGDDGGDGQPDNPGGSVELDSAERQRRFVDSIRSDPVRFIEWLWASPLDEWQRKAARDFASGQRTARAVANGGGKTRLFAGLGVWFISCRFDSKVVMTAGSNRQLASMHLELEKVMHKLAGFELIQHELKHPCGNRMIWYSTDNPGLAEGHHAQWVALLIDEAKSVPDSIAQASERLQATHTLVMSSAGAQIGWFYNLFTKNRARWKAEQIPAHQCERVPKDWIAHLAAEYGTDSDLYKSSVMAEFTSAESGAFISLEAVNNCIKFPPIHSGHEIVVGIDPAATPAGDETVIVIRKGNKITDMICFRETDTMRCAGRCVAELRQRKISSNINADAGGPGVGVIDRMAEVGLPVTKINFGGNPFREKERFGNKMTEMWNEMKSQIEGRKIIIPDDAELIAQLTTRKAEHLSTGRIKLESKELMKRRGLKSPDRADALAMCLIATYSPAPLTGWQWNQDEDEIEGHKGFQPGFSADGRFNLGN